MHLCAAMEFYRRSPNVHADMAEMEAEGKASKEAHKHKATGHDEPSSPSSVKGSGLSNPVDVDSMPLPSTSLTVAENEEDDKYTLMQILRDADLRTPLFIACMLVIIQQFSGINAVSVWHATLIKIHFTLYILQKNQSGFDHDLQN